MESAEGRSPKIPLFVVEVFAVRINATTPRALLVAEQEFRIFTMAYGRMLQSGRLAVANFLRRTFRPESR